MQLAPEMVLCVFGIVENLDVWQLCPKVTVLLIHVH